MDFGCRDVEQARYTEQKLGVQIYGCTGENDSKEDVNAFDLSEFGNNMFDTITCINTLPFAGNMQGESIDETLSELHRVLKKKGVLIVREYDVIDEWLASVLNIQYGMYATVWTDADGEVVDPEFTTNFNATYYTKEYLHDKFIGAGFTRKTSTESAEQIMHKKVGRETIMKIRNPFRSYVSVYVKA